MKTTYTPVHIYCTQNPPCETAGIRIHLGGQHNDKILFPFLFLDLEMLKNRNSIVLKKIPMHTSLVYVKVQQAHSF